MENENLTSEQEKMINETFSHFSNAEKLNDDDVNTVLNHEEDIKNKSLKGALKKFADEIKLLIEMVKSYANGSYNYNCRCPYPCVCFFTDRHYS